MRMSHITTIVMASILVLSTAYVIQPTRASFVEGPQIGWLTYAPSSDPIRTQTCARIAAAAAGIGLLDTCAAQSFGGLVNRVFGAQNYQSYILGWLLSPIPTFNIYDLFNSGTLIIPGGSNNVHVNDSAYDTISTNFRFVCNTAGPLSNPSSCGSLAQQAETYVYTHGYYFPMYNRASDGAVRNDSYSGYYSQNSNGLIFTPFFTFMNAHVRGSTALPSTGQADNVTVGRPFTFGTRDGISGSYNPIAATDNTFDLADVDAMIWDSLMILQPVTNGLMPWLATGINKAGYTGPFTNGVPGTVYHWTLASNATWANGAPLTSYDVAFTINLLTGKYAADGVNALFFSSINHLTHFTITGPHSIDVYYNATNYWLDYDAALPVFPSARWNGTDGVLCTGGTPCAGAPTGEALSFKTAAQSYEPPLTTTGVSNFWLGTGPYTVSAVNDAAGTVALTRRPGVGGSGGVSYWRPDPTPAQQFDFINAFSCGKYDCSTGLPVNLPAVGNNPTNVYHNAWLQHLFFTTVGQDQSTLITTKGSTGEDETGWNLPSSASVINLVRTDPFVIQTSTPNYGVFYYAVNLDQGSTKTNPFGTGQNPFSNVWQGTVNIGALFRFSINRLIDRNAISSTICGSSLLCPKVRGVLLNANQYIFGTYDWHNSTIDSDTAANYSPAAMNATLKTLATMNLAQFDSNGCTVVSPCWHYVNVQAVPAIPNPLVFLAIIGVAAPILYRRIRTLRQ